MASLGANTGCEAIQRFGQWMHDSSVPSGFIPLQSLKEYFNHNQIQNTLQTLDSRSWCRIDANQFQRDYLRIFAILICIGKGNYIADFVQHNLKDQYLPFDTRPPQFPVATDDILFFERFYAEQWKFCVPSFHYKEERFRDEYILPIIRKEPIHESPSSKLYKIAIHPEYNQLVPKTQCVADSKGAGAYVFALKSYSGKTAERHFKSEVENMRKLHTFCNNHQHLIQFYGSYIHAGTHNIILEYAQYGTLEEYFHRQPSPLSPRQIPKFWNQLLGLAGALKQVHEILSNAHDETSLCNRFHADVKPRNILLADSECCADFSYLFKFSKFTNISPPENDKDLIFDIHDAYCPPECYQRKGFSSNAHSVKQADIWSLGCVFLEALTWLTFDTSVLDDYLQQRTNETTRILELGAAGCFHNEKPKFKTMRRMLQNIQESIYRSDCVPGYSKFLCDSGGFTESIIKLIEDMLEDSERRLNAAELWARSQRIMIKEEDKFSQLRESGSAHIHHDIKPYNIPHILKPYLARNGVETSPDSANALRAPVLGISMVSWPLYGKSLGFPPKRGLFTGTFLDGTVYAICTGLCAGSSLLFREYSRSLHEESYYPWPSLGHGGRETPPKRPSGALFLRVEYAKNMHICGEGFLTALHLPQWIQKPTPIVFIGASIVYGIAFTILYQLRRKDRFVNHILIGGIFVVLLLGWAFGLDALEILMDFVPWVMLFSVLGSAVIPKRSCGKRSRCTNEQP